MSTPLANTIGNSRTIPLCASYQLECRLLRQNGHRGYIPAASRHFLTYMRLSCLALTYADNKHNCRDDGSDYVEEEWWLARLKSIGSVPQPIASLGEAI